MSQHRSFQHRVPVRAGRLLCALFLAQALATLAASPAHAGIWTLVSCTQPDGTPAPTEGWSTGALGAVGPYSGDLNTCAAGGTLTARSSGEAPQSAYGGPEWVFSAPAGSTVAGGTLTAALTAPSGQAWLGTPETTYDSADVLANGFRAEVPAGQSGFPYGDGQSNTVTIGTH